MELGILSVGAAALVGLGLAEALWHRRNLRHFRHRIHVAGTRGKSSVTRLVAAGMRAAGIATVAKTTGSVPRVILPDARERPVFRPRGANIVEIMRVVSAARASDAEAIVVECMALQPELHWVSEHQLVRATHAVITNTRPDHLDVMGPALDDVTRCLCGIIPPGGVLVSGERAPSRRAIIAEAAADRGATLVEVRDDAVASVRDDELAAFRYLEHRENVAVALALLAQLGVARQTALEAMWRMDPDPGALSEHVIAERGREIVFVNAFAANDPQSSETVWRMTRERHRDIDRVIAVFNLRADRADRTRQLAGDATFWHEADEVVLMGSGAHHFARAAAERTPARLRYADQHRVAEVFETIVGLCGARTLVIGIGNIGEQGLPLVKLFHDRRALSRSA